MFKQLSRNARLSTLLLLLLSALGNAQIISAKMPITQNPSIETASKSSPVVVSTAAIQPKKIDLSSKNMTTTPTSSSNLVTAKFGSLGEKMTSNQPILNPYDQFIIPVGQAWAGFGGLTLQTLASDEFYAKNKSAPVNQSSNNMNVGNITSNGSSKATPSPPATPNIPASDTLNNSFMTQNELKSLESELTQAKLSSNDAFTNSVKPSKTNSQFPPLIYVKQYQSGSKPASNIASSPSNFIFSSNTDKPTASDNLIIDNLRNSINSRFNSFFGP